MGRRIAWAALVAAMVVVGVGGYEVLRGSAHQAREMTITGRK